MVQYSKICSYLSSYQSTEIWKCHLIYTLSRLLFGVEVSLRLSTPLTLKEPRACQRKLPCAKYTQGAPNGTAGIRGIPRFLCRPRRCRGGIDRLIDRSNERTNERTILSEISQLRDVEASLAFGEKALSAQPEIRGILISVKIYALPRIPDISDTRVQVFNAFFL